MNDMSRILEQIQQGEPSAALGISRATASRHWHYARAWLINALDEIVERTNSSRRLMRNNNAARRMTYSLLNYCKSTNASGPRTPNLGSCGLHECLSETDSRP
jgi:hypothetical protein